MSEGARLPLPDAVVAHHSQVLAGPMAEWRSRNRIPPVLLLTGIAGVGKSSMAHYLAQWIFCEKAGPQPCRGCPSCRKLESGASVDFTEIRADSGESLKIDQFRELKARMGFGAHEGAYRIIHIPNADRMTVQAANSVLKLLEEPPRGWIFLLTAADPSLLLPTIVSRCQAIRLRPFPAETLETLIGPELGDPKKRSITAALAQGSWGRALQWAEPEAWERRRLLLDFFADPKAHLTPLVDWAALEPRNMDRMIDQLESLAADLIGWSLDAGSPESHRWINEDAAPTLVQRAKAALQSGAPAARASWIYRAERLARARQELLAPLNRKLMAQELLMPWLSSGAVGF